MLRSPKRFETTLRHMFIDQVHLQEPDFKTVRGGFDPNAYYCDTSIDSEDFIGRGSFGRVYKASLFKRSDETDHQPYNVAVKVVPLSDDKNHIKYQQRELEFFNQFYRNTNFYHPNIIKYLGFTDYTMSKTHCIHMELCQLTLAPLSKCLDLGKNFRQWGS